MIQTRARYLPAILAAALYLLFRRYAATGNDGYLYMLFGLAWLDPARFHSDLLVLHGSQDSFTLFSPIYGSLISLVGVEAAEIALLLIGGGLWLLGTWRLAGRILDRSWAVVALFCLAALQPFYGGWNILNIGESVLTPRLFAEAFVLLGLAAHVERRFVAGGAFLALALAFHPLMALPGIAAVFFVHPSRRVLVAAVLAGLAAWVAAVIGIEPFSRLLTRPDPQWFEWMKARDGYVFLSRWSSYDWYRLAIQATAVAVAAASSDGMARRFFVAVLITAAGGLLVAAVGADWLHSLLIIQLQAWRATWLLAWAAIPAVVHLASRARTREDWIAPVALGLAVVFEVSGLGAALFAVIGAAAATGLLRGIRPRIRDAALLAVCAVFVVVLAAELAGAWMWQSRLRPDIVTAGPVALSLGARAVAIAAAILIYRQGTRRFAVAAGGGLLAAAALLWDSRSDWQKYIIRGPAPALPGKGPVLWGSQPFDTWMLLRRPAYLSLAQSSGLIFSRPTAAEWFRRYPLVRGIVSHAEGSAKPSFGACAAAEPALSPGDLRAICSAGGLDGVILAYPAGPSIRFETPVDQTQTCLAAGKLAKLRHHIFYFHPCRDLQP